MKKFYLVYFSVLLILMIGPNFLLVPAAFLSTLAVPVNAAWNKDSRKREWRIFTLLSCLLALTGGIYFGFIFRSGGLYGVPFPVHEAAILGKLLNFSVISALTLLPLSAASTIDAWRRRRRE